MILKAKVLIGLTLVALQLPTASIADSILQSTIGNRIEITLGSKIPNPYSVDEIFDVQASDDEKQAAVTHLYIKFKPETADDEALLNNTSDISLSISPLDYELEHGGTTSGMTAADRLVSITICGGKSKSASAGHTL